MNISAADHEVTISPFIDGSFKESRSTRLWKVVNPSNGRTLYEFAEGSEADGNAAVQGARASFDDGRWHRSPPSSRKGVLHQLASLIDSHADELDRLDAEEMGKPVNTPFCNAKAAAGLMRFFGEAIDKVSGDVYPSDAHSLVVQRRVPRGVVVAIVPWNFPTFNAVLKVAPALAAGNSLVLKPSELSPRSALRIAQLAMEAGLPPGVLNVVPGRGAIVGQCLALHMGVDMLTFTGSTAIGKRMLQYAGQSNMKAVITECGGKSPQIIFGDGVDLDGACRSVTDLLLTNQGQICSVGSRLLVQRSVQASVVERICRRAKEAEIGDALDKATTFGPLVSRAQMLKVAGYIETGKSEGATLAAGGHRALTDSGGFYIEPTIFTDVRPDSTIAQEEIFGPVLSIIPFDDVSDAIQIANSTKYGLIAYAWTAQLSTALRLMKGIRSSILLNAAAPLGEGPGHALSSEPAGESGVGTETGLAGLESYMRRQLAWFNHN